MKATLTYLYDRSASKCAMTLISSVATSLLVITLSHAADETVGHSLVQHPYSVRNVLTTLQAEVSSLNARIGSLVGANTSLQTALNSAQNDIATLKSRIRTLESRPAGGVPDLEKYLSIETNAINGMTGPHILITGANVHIRSGSGATDEYTSASGNLTGLGNLIIGYNEFDPSGQPRTGSHNLVGGSFNSFTSTGGLVFGLRNDLSGQYAAILSGDSNTASGLNASVLGGHLNKASGLRSSVYGGLSNTAVNMNSYSPLQQRPTSGGN